MCAFGLDFEKLCPDIYLSEEQLTPPDICAQIRKMNLHALAAIIRYTASEFRYGGLPGQAYDRANSSVKNIQPVDCDRLYCFLNAIADNIQSQIQKGETK